LITWVMADGFSVCGDGKGNGNGNGNNNNN
jgi:hypothetical protein